MKHGILIAILVATTAAAPGFLALVDLAKDQDVFTVAELGIPVLMPLEDACLVRVESGELELLDASGFEFRILDENPALKQYVCAMPDPALNSSALARYGTVLAEDPEGVVLRTDDEGVRGLNTLQVELAGINMYPLAPRGRASTPCPAVVDDSLVWELVNRVSADTVEALLVRMREFVTRYSETDSCFSAMEWVRSRFESWGCSTYLDTYRTGWGPNAVGIKRGRVNQDAVFVICGHTDATSRQPWTLTPGSEDNASGTAAVMELCRVTADMDFENTLWFIGFCGEEQGLVGSDSFARHAMERGDSIVLSVNFDMISFGRAGQQLDTIVFYGSTASPPSVEWVNFFRAQADTFSTLKHIADIENTPARRSDHYSFWKYGFPYVRGGYYDRTPMYHTIGDTIGPADFYNCGSNNVPMEAEVIKALVATIAKLGGAHVPVAVEGPPSGRLAVRMFEAIPSVGPAPISLRMSIPLNRTSAVEVYDATGSLVRRMPGSETTDLSWDGRDDSGRGVSTGIYMFRIAGLNRASVTRAVLAR